MSKLKPELISNKCNFCGEQLIPDKFDFYICIGCGGQACPPNDSKREVKKQILDAMALNHLVSDPVMRVKSHTCGSKSKGKSSKQAMQKPSTKNIYNLLCVK